MKGARTAIPIIPDGEEEKEARNTLDDGDVMVIAFQKFGRPLRNPIRIDRSKAELVKVKPL